MADYKPYSSDSHVSEPPNLWVERVDQRFRDRAPRVEEREQDGKMQDFMIYEGFRPHPVSVGLAAAAVDGNKIEFEKTRGTYGNARPGGWDPAERLKDQDIDGLEGEVLHCTLGFRLFWLEDAALQREVFRVYNDWLAEFISYNPQRLIGIGLISLYDIDEARKELRRIVKLGLRGGMVWISPPADRPYSSTDYDPFWAEAQELGLPLVLHGITGFAESRLSIAYWNPAMVLFAVTEHHEAERTLATLILSGVLERFPRLRIVSAENGTGWMPYFLRRLARSLRFRGNSYPANLTLSPDEYFRRQVAVTYIDEQEAVESRAIIGEDALMWASDYPHFASTWPNSDKIIERDFAGVPEAARRKLVHDNVLKLYNMAGVEVPQVAAGD